MFANHVQHNHLRNTDFMFGNDQEVTHAGIWFGYNLLFCE